MDEKRVTVNFGCFGCLLSIVGLIGLLWVAFHVSEIVQFVTG